MAAEHETWIVKLFSGIPKREQRALTESLSRLRGQLTRENTMKDLTEYQAQHFLWSVQNRIG